MNIFKKILVLVVITSLILSIPSCIVLTDNNGKHKGWYKNPRNPHNPQHKDKKPGHSKGKHKK